MTPDQGTALVSDCIQWTCWEGRQWQTDGVMAVRRDVWPAPLTRSRPAYYTHDVLRGGLALVGSARPAPFDSGFLAPFAALVTWRPSESAAIAEQVTILLACAGTSELANASGRGAVTAGWDSAGELCAVVAHWALRTTTLPTDHPPWLCSPDTDTLTDHAGRPAVRRLGLQWEWVWPHGPVEWRESHALAEEAVDAAIGWRNVYLA